ncbi:M23 family metallopeptidase [Neobacillus mesonae]|nr:M23 family metallopeptidase [Neobacillus mesonae]
MSNLKDNMSPSDNSSPKKALSKPRKWLLVTAAGLFVVMSAGFASETYVTANTIPYYNVYVKGEHIGAVKSEKELQDLYESKTEAYQQKYPDANMQLDTSTVEIKEERAYKPEINSDETLAKLEGMLTGYAKGVELKVDGKVIGIVKDQKTADQIIQTVKNQYITEEKAVNTASKIKTVAAVTSKESRKPQEDQVSLESVKLEEQVALQNVKASPSEVLSSEEAVKLLTESEDQKSVYVVKEGDNLTYIAKRYNTTVAELKKLNPDLEEDSLLIGHELTLMLPKPPLTVQTVENVVEEIETEPQVEIRETDELKAGVTKVVREGQTGLKKVEYRITKENGEVVNEEWLGQEVIDASVSKVVLQGTKVTGEGSGIFKWPVTNATISSSFGQRWGKQHKGIDLVGNKTIMASDEGVVTFAGQQNGYGNVIIINHRNGYETVYGHLDSIGVKEGQVVEQGESIGVMGNTGRSTGTHLHFEIKKNSVVQNPMKYLP